MLYSRPKYTISLYNITPYNIQSKLPRIYQYNIQNNPHLRKCCLNINASVIIMQLYNKWSDACFLAQTDNSSCTAYTHDAHLTLHSHPIQTQPPNSVVSLSFPIPHSVLHQYHRLFFSPTMTPASTYRLTGSLNHEVRAKTPNSALTRVTFRLKKCVKKI